MHPRKPQLDGTCREGHATLRIIFYVATSIHKIHQTCWRRMGRFYPLRSTERRCYLRSPIDDHAVSALGWVLRGTRDLRDESLNNISLLDFCDNHLCLLRQRRLQEEEHPVMRQKLANISINERPSVLLHNSSAVGNPTLVSHGLSVRRGRYRSSSCMNLM